MHLQGACAVNTDDDYLMYSTHSCPAFVYHSNLMGGNVHMRIYNAFIGKFENVVRSTD